MVRQRQQRKSVEELYATKFEANGTKSAVNASNNIKNARGGGGADREYNSGYIITSNTPYNAAQSCAGAATNLATSRRKTARPSTSMKAEKLLNKDEKILNLDEVKKDTNIKVKTSRNEKCAYISPQNMCDNKSFVNFSDNLHHKDSTQRSSHNHTNSSYNNNSSNNNHHHHHHDDDKDDDTEEFFELIRQTVETAIGKSISDLLNRNFRELAAKIDRFSAELKATNTNLNKLQAEINNKVVHYGEENSRHFRYLCMKSEYDKMFYQHHTMMASTTQLPDKGVPLTQHSDPLPQQMQQQQQQQQQPQLLQHQQMTQQQQQQQQHPRKRMNNNNVKKSNSKSDCDKAGVGGGGGGGQCTCRSAKGASSLIEPHKSSSEEHTGISNKSSDMGMREVLEHIQRFCNQMQLNDFKSDERMPKNSFRIEDALKINKQVFEDDDDEFQLSSDGMTPRSDEHLPQHKYGGTTMRSSCNTTRGGNGGGDA